MLDIKCYFLFILKFGPELSAAETIPNVGMSFKATRTPEYSNVHFVG